MWPFRRARGQQGEPGVAGLRVDPATLHNSFAMAFALAGDHRSAAGQFTVIGDRVTNWPWSYLSGGPVEASESRRRVVGATPE